MSQHTIVNFMGCCVAPFLMGEVKIGGDIHRAPSPDGFHRERHMSVISVTAIELHLMLRVHTTGKDPRSPLVHGKMEGWVKIRLAGQVDWKRLWLVVQSGGGGNAGADDRPSSPSQSRGNRMSKLFSRPQSPKPQSPSRASITLYPSPKPKDKKKASLTMFNLSQVFAVYPERPELISRSTLIKVEGQMGEEEMTGGMRGRDGWLLIMPELEQGKLGSLEMLKWVVGMLFYKYEFSFAVLSRFRIA